MPPVAEEVARARSLAALTAAACEWPAEQIEAAEHLAERLGRQASAIVDSSGGVPECSVAGCPLDHHRAGQRAIRLASALSAAHNSSPRQDPDGGAGGDPDAQLTSHRRYVQALRDAGAVVYCCRRVLHTNGQCFFDADGPDSGLCGRVLTVSHQLEHDLLVAG